MQTKRGEIEIRKLKFAENEYAIGVSVPYSCRFDEEGNSYEKSTNLNTKAFRIFMNQCVGSPNMTIFKSEELRNERYEKGKQILLNAGYTVTEYSK